MIRKRRIGMGASEERLARLIEERIRPLADKKRIDQSPPGAEAAYRVTYSLQ